MCSILLNQAVPFAVSKADILTRGLSVFRVPGPELSLLLVSSVQ